MTMTTLRTPPVTWAFGSYPAALALEPGPRFALAAAIAAAPLNMVPLPGRALGLVAAAYIAAWLAMAVGHDRCFTSCRRRSRQAGLRVLVVVPESPWLAARLHRKRGIEIASGRLVCSVHADTSWRSPAGLPPGAAAKAFGRQYRRDYDLLLRTLHGQSVVVASSTFNRHESRWTETAMATGWGLQRAGPLFGAAPARNGPRVRACQQCRMFGAVVSRRCVSRADAWRTRVFDCREARTVS